MTRLSVKALLCILTLLPIGILSAPALASSSACSAAGTTGLTAKLVVGTGAFVTGTVDATGCDVGVFVAPGSTNVVISGATVSGAGIHGIFVQDSSNVIIYGNSVHNNSAGVRAVSCDFVAPPCVAEGKAIQLVGTSHSTISNNMVFDDMFGGVGVADDGSTDPGALHGGSANDASWNTVSGNTFWNVANDCSIVVATYNTQHADYNLILDNTITGSSPPFGVNPYVGQIVIAGDAPGGTISGTVVFGNSDHGSTLPGIVIHSNAPGDLISNTIIWDNTETNNGYYPPFFSSIHTPVAANGTTGIAIEAEAFPGMPNPPAITGTILISNTVTDNNGVWVCGSTGTTIWLLSGGSTNPVVTCASGGS